MTIENSRAPARSAALRLRDDLVRADERVDRRVGLREVGRLRAEAAVLGAAAALRVGDPAERDLVAVHRAAHRVRALEQRLELGAGGVVDEPARLLAGDGLDAGRQRRPGLAHGRGTIPGAGSVSSTECDGRG